MLALSVVGVFVIRSATVNQEINIADKQVLGIVLGLLALMIITVLDYRFLMKFSIFVYGMVVALLASVLFFGKTVNHAKRWILLPVIGQFQPSEVAKIGLILFFAWFFFLMRERISKLTTLLMSMGLLGVPLLLILIQPNLSTSLVIAFIVICMLFAAGISYKWVLGVLLTVIPSFGILLYFISIGKQTFLKDYQVVRIMSWIKPLEYIESFYQQKNSIRAVASGMLWGKGLNNPSIESVKNGNYLSEVETDFIFAVVGEELGFVGSMVVIGLLLLIVFECMLIAARTKDLAGRLICVGMAALIGFQSFVNIAVVTGLFPNTGLTLPFVSYGVTSLISLYMGVGFVLNVGIYGKNRI